MIKASVIAFPMFVAIVLVLFVVGVYRFTRESAPIRTTGKVTYGRCSERSTTSLMLVKTVTQSDGTSEMWLFGSDGKRVYPSEESLFADRAPELVTCVELTERQFRQELKYRRLLN